MVKNQSHVMCSPPPPLLVTADQIFTEYYTAFQWTVILSLRNVLHRKVAHKQNPITTKEAPQLERRQVEVRL
jgi:hypothetical protein